MSPSFLPGDRLYADPRPARPAGPGDVVVLRDPERPGALLLKRVAVAPPGTDPGRLWLVGDNAAQSRDSRRFGAVGAGALVGVVWFRYAPSPRRGPVPARSLK